ncbi:MAG TPA: orotidine-5'-phosphate decarboxylase [Thermoanaerobaculia bacterium]|jgi:orotidine-5'-phosphate decarboxylase|nr:orotidine-5'-phosphate decarboxylase [Thermoanaerobaculia bacterium]
MGPDFSDRLIAAIRDRGSPCVVGLDPRLETMPRYLVDQAAAMPRHEAAYAILAGFGEAVVDAVADHVPAVKVQSAFYELLGVPGLRALLETVRVARAAGLLVIVDAKRGDIASTAAAYAEAFLGELDWWGQALPTVGADAATVSPYLGADSFEPWVDVCRRHGKGIFVLARTSNQGSADLQGLRLAGGGTVDERVAAMVDRLGEGLVGGAGYSSVGAVVGATFPADAARLRRLMPRAIFLLPGYGAQGGGVEGLAACFDRDGLGAVVSASRSVTYPKGAEAAASAGAYRELVRASLLAMIADVKAALARRA